MENTYSCGDTIDMYLSVQAGQIRMVFKTKELILLYLNERGNFHGIHMMQKKAGDAAKKALHYFFVNLRTQ